MKNTVESEITSRLLLRHAMTYEFQCRTDDSLSAVVAVETGVSRPHPLEREEGWTISRLTYDGEGYVRHVLVEDGLGFVWAPMEWVRERSREIDVVSREDEGDAVTLALRIADGEVKVLETTK